MCIPSAPDIPPPPAPPEIPQAPTEVNPAVLAARKTARTTSAAQSGFASTILTGGRGVNSAGLPTGGSVLTAGTNDEFTNITNNQTKLKRGSGRPGSSSGSILSGTGGGGGRSGGAFREGRGRGR
jgi:uncharacterized membrane protein YgcG